MNWKFIILAFCLAALLYCLYKMPDSFVHIYICDVGQGDATLISYAYTQVLIDGGKDSRVLACLRSAMPLGDKKLELVIATHADADHIGGLAGVLSQYLVDTVFVPAQSKKTADFKDFNAAVLRALTKKTTVLEPVTGTEIRITDSLRLTVVSHQGSDGRLDPVWSTRGETLLSDFDAQKDDLDKDTNNGSIVIYLKHNSTSALFTGDLELEGEQALLKSGLIIKSTLLKVGHHGSKSSTSQGFIDSVAPEISVISVGRKNKYGHPHEEIINRLLSHGVKILRTDEKGTIEFVSDGHSFHFVPHWQLL